MLFSSSPLPRGMGSLFLFGLLGGGTFQFAPKYHTCWQLTWVPESWGRGSWVSTGGQAQRRNLTSRVTAGPPAPSAQCLAATPTVHPAPPHHYPTFFLGLGVGGLSRNRQPEFCVP